MADSSQTALSGLAGCRLLITGATGFIGARVCRMAVASGAIVGALTRAGSNRMRLDGQPLTLIESTQDEVALTRAFSEFDPDAVIHGAGIPDSRQIPELVLPSIAAHTQLTAKVLEASRTHRVQRVVLIGSAGEYGDAAHPMREDGPHLPLDPYSVSKLAATHLALVYHRAFGLPCSVVRPFVVYGPGDNPTRALASVLEKASAAPNRAFSPGEQIRDFVFVDDVAEGVLRTLLSQTAAGEVLNLGTGVGTALKTAILLAARVSGHGARLDFGALPYRPGELMRIVASTASAQRVLGWSPPTALEEGLKKYWQEVASR